MTRKIRAVRLENPQRDRLPHQLFEFEGSLSRDEVDYEFEASADTGFAIARQMPVGSCEEKKPATAQLDAA